MTSRHMIGILVMTTLALSACSVQRSNHAARAQRDLVGISKAQLFRCAGLPDRQEKVGDDEFLPFDNDLLTSGGITIPIIGGGVNFFDSKYCHATAVLRQGRLQALHFAGNASSPLAELDQCGYIIDTCIERLDRVRKDNGEHISAADLDRFTVAAEPEPRQGGKAEAETATPAQADAADKPDQTASAAAKPRRARGRPSPGR